MSLILLAALLLYLGVGFYHARFKPLPRHVSFEGASHRVEADDIEFLYDVTGYRNGRRVARQMIFDRVIHLIRDARHFVLADFFLFNAYPGRDARVHRRLCRSVCRELVEFKRRRPHAHVVVITDPVNEAYGGPVPAHFEALRAAGIPVVVTDLSRLRDSNPLYSAAWRLVAAWLGRSPRRYLTHPLSRSAPGVGLRSWLSLLNFKANHRKLVIADAPGNRGPRLVSLVLSANPHDASSAHGNVALLVRNGIWEDLLQSEQAILDFSGHRLDLRAALPAPAASVPCSPLVAASGPAARVRVLTEGRIRHALLTALAGLGRGDGVDIGMFYLAERSLIQALLDAARRGVRLRLVLDPNQEAFGYPKYGIPNRPVATELARNGGGELAIRWALTRGEQFHGKMVLMKRAESATLIVGSANLTRRNLRDFNLETDLMVTGPRGLPVFRSAEDYFEGVWTNRELDCSRPLEALAESSRWAYWWYRFQEGSGASTF